MGRLYRGNAVSGVLRVLAINLLWTWTGWSAGVSAQDGINPSLVPARTGQPVLSAQPGLETVPGPAVPLPAGYWQAPELSEEPEDEPWGTPAVVDSNGLSRPQFDGQLWSWQVLPSGLIFRSYLAGAKEPRISANWVYERDWGWIWDNTLGARVGLVRYGTSDPFSPEGFQLDLEAAGQPRLDMEHQEDVIAADFRFGVPLTYGNRRFQTKLAMYHLSSHMGDEYMIRLQSLDRINYSRNAIVWGNSYFPVDTLRLYAEAGWAFHNDGGSKPWEFQFGIEYAPSEPTGSRPVPFVAINSHLRQDVNYGGNLVVQSGWAWRGVSGQMFRMGMQYYTGKSDQYQFFNWFEDKIGLGLWYDY